MGATFGVAFIALVAVLGLGALSVATTQAVTEPLEQMAAWRGAVAQGDLSVTIPPAGDDEVGDVLRAMSDMVAYLNEMAAVAQAVARGRSLAHGDAALGGRPVRQRARRDGAATSPRCR